MLIEGRVWRFGDDIDTDLLAPGAYMKSPLEVLASHCLEALAPDFAGAVRRGDILVAGDNFGIGSSREQAAEALRHLGVGAVVARSFGGIFFRNALNLGLPALTLDADAVALDALRQGDAASVDLASGELRGGGRVIACRPLPRHLRALVAAGGLMPYLEQKLRDA